MATAAITPPRSQPIALPNGTGDNKRAQINPNYVTPVHLVEKSEETGEYFVVEELPELPLGTREIYVQHRMCGDFYCFIHGERQVAAIGDTLPNAFRNALKQVRA